MKAHPNRQKIERARLHYEKVLQLYRARPTDALYDVVQRAHEALQVAKADAVVDGWSPPATVCSRCQTPLSRREGVFETRYGCVACGFSLSVCR
ncbi:MAG: hypothetical protein AAFQ82_21820 [Myxococcota bacterium]